MALADTDLKGILLSHNYLSEQDVVQAEEHAKQHGQSLQNSLFDLSLLTQDLLESAVAEHFKLPYRDLQQHPPAENAVGLLPEAVCQAFHAVVTEDTGTSVTVVTSDPGNPKLEEAVRLNLHQTEAVLPGEEPKPEEKKGLLSFGAKAKPGRQPYAGKIAFEYAPQAGIDAVLVHLRKPLVTRFQAILEGRQTAAPEILDEILQDAQELHASDIHFEPQRDKVTVVRFRVDGVLHEAGRIPKEHYDAVINRIKIAANMRTDEHFAAQDGAIRYDGAKGKTTDVRVSIVPVVDGEKVVMRVLSQYVRSVTLTDLGFCDRDRELLELNAKKPFGMVLTTGPTGSGKSTTLYALMKMRNHPDVNISTIEDPVEYKLTGVNHIQVNPKTDLTFATGLRALVRQDPDIILVGEIRDGETADISVNAALTGHLVFSTLHANDAATAVPRLIEMGVEPFLLASTLELVMAQRLVRRICPQCRYSYGVTKAELAAMHPHLGAYVTEETLLLYKGKGCQNCGGTGFKGRIGIYEMLEITPEMEALIIGRATSNEINAAARRAGMHLLFEDGFEKMLRGVTSVEELLRVAAPPEPLTGQAPAPRPAPPSDAPHGRKSR